MAEETTPPGFAEPRSDVPMQELEALDNAIAKARATLDDMQDAAADAAEAGGTDPRLTLHEINGIGRYAVPRQKGWIPLLSIINDLTVDIDFSIKNYPSFDAILDDHFDGAPFSDPLHDDYESYKNLRDNVAAVRNFLMETYYSHPPQGMTPEKAKKALEQIAAYVGDGLHNNYLFLSIVPNHNPTKPFISVSEARKPNGEGAQYIYEKILAMQRHNNWMRPFDAVVALFGGKTHIDWKLPPAEATPFRDHFADELAPPAMSVPPTAEEIAAQQQYLQKLEARRVQLRQSAQLTMMALDMDAIGNHLLYTSDNMQGVANVSEPVRREAVEIAKDILRKLKLAFGDMNILDGLKLKPADDMATLGAVKGVAMVYERLVAWARGIDPTIMQHPSVMAATRAIGQLGYLSKLEAYKLAKLGGNSVLADKIKSQLDRIPSYFSEANDSRFGSLLDKVERGIDTVMNRVHEVNGPNAMVGHKPAKDISSFMNNTPIAGQALHISSDASSNRAKQQATMIQAQDMAEQVQASRIQSQIADRARQTGQSPPAAQPAGRVPGRQAIQQARQAQTRQASTSSSTAATNPAIANPGLSQAQRSAAQRNAWLAQQQREQDEHHHSPQEVVQKIDPRIIQGMRQATNTANLPNQQPLATTRAAYDAQQRANAQAAAARQAMAAQQKPNTTPSPTDAERLRAQQAAIQPPTPPKGRGGPGM